MPRGRAWCARVSPAAASTSSWTARSTSWWTARRGPGWCVATSSARPPSSSASRPSPISWPTVRCASSTSPARTCAASCWRTRGHVSGPRRPDAAPAEREPVAEVAGPVERPFPPGDYPLVVVGSGPGAIQVSYASREWAWRHAVLSRGSAPGGMFRRFPFFQRLLSWTKPYAPAARGERAFERYDWNSLLAREGDDTPVAADQAVWSTSWTAPPSSPRGRRWRRHRRVRRAHGCGLRYGCTWTSRPRGGARRRPLLLHTSDGTYRARVLDLCRGRRRGVAAGHARHGTRRPLRLHAPRR